MTNNSSVNSASVKLLVQLWAERYRPDWSTLPIEADFVTLSQLVEVALPGGKVQTVAKVRRYFQESYSSTGREANTLFSYIPNVVTLSEAQHLAEFTKQVYEKILEIYQQHLPPSVALGFSSTLEMPGVEQLATELEPVFQQLREQHMLAQDPRALGFITTPFHLSTKSILRQLTVPEQVLISPYFKFVEEQLCIPWQRICSAAARHHPESQTMTVVQEMLPLSQEIAETVYHRATELYPAHRSRRGELSNLDVKASTIRDLNMFQAYLWLSVLEESMAAVEQALVPLCVMVFPSVEVRWQLVRHMVQLLVEELVTRMEPAGAMHLVMPYAQAMLQLFSCPYTLKHQS